MQKPILIILFISLFSLMFAISCDTDDPFQFPDPDFSTVPPPYQFQNVEPVEVEEGVEVYVLDEGSGPFEVTARDQVSVFLTLRTTEGDEIYSTFTDDRVSAIPVSMRVAGDIQNSLQFSILWAYTPGFKSGLLGMKEGERRTIIVSPEKGYRSASPNNVNAQYRESTLQYDVQVSVINPKKSAN